MHVSANDEEMERVKVEYNLLNEEAIVDIQVVSLNKNLSQEHNILEAV